MLTFKLIRVDIKTAEVQHFNAGLKLNEKEIFDKGECLSWSPLKFEERIFEKLADKECVFAIDLDSLNQPTELTDQSLDAIAQLPTFKRGY